MATPAVPTAEPNTPTPTAEPIITRLTLEIVSVTSPVRVGTEATLRAKTAPGAECLITVFYKPGERIRPHLEAKTADDAGNVSWTWRVGSGPGTWPVWVTARSHGQIEIEKTTYTVENDGQDGNAEPNDGKSSAPSPTTTAVATTTPASKPNDDQGGAPSTGQPSDANGNDRANPDDSQSGGKNEGQSGNSNANRSTGNEGKNGDGQSGSPNGNKDNTNQSTNEGSKNTDANSSRNDGKSSNNDGKNAKRSRLASS